MAGDRLLAGDLAVLAPAVVEPHAPQVDLRLKSGPSGETFLAQQRVGYPFHLGRSLFMPGDPPGMPTLYVQSCSGGIFEHDRLAWRVVAEAGTRVHLTSSASTIVHSMAAGEARQEVWIEAHAGALVEYLPDPLVLFSDARLTARLRIASHADASVLACDAIVPHDQHGGDRPFGWIDSETRVCDLGGALAARDRYRLSGQLVQRALPGVTGTHRCQGTFLALTSMLPAARLAAALRQTAHATSGVYASASTLPRARGAWLRVLAPDAAALREALQRAWYAAREALLGTQPAPRRK
jgi:urease accessory protein